MIAAVSASAVTDREMEEARTIAAKTYLRWADNGSGYLDELNVKTMSELEAKLRTKEKENIKAFKAVKTPTDYAGWDRDKLAEYWGSTFFASPGLSADGVRGKERVRKAVMKMTVSAPSATPTPAQETPAPAVATSQPAPIETVQTPDTAMQQPALDEQILADQQAIAEDLEQREQSSPKKSSNTLIYVIALVILIGVVIWLVVYAANIMKKQNAEAAAAGEGVISDGNAGESYAVTDEELLRENGRLKEENRMMASELATANGRLSEMRAQVESLSRQLRAAKSSVAAATAAPVAPPVISTTDPGVGADKILNVMYLGRANNRGQFVRGDRRPSPGNTIYRLDTRDGLVGTFRVADTDDALDLALSDPMTYLAGGCLADNFEDAPMATNIITESPGTAILENNCWKVLRKSKIRFEK